MQITNKKQFKDILYLYIEENYIKVNIKLYLKYKLDYKQLYQNFIKTKIENVSLVKYSIIDENHYIIIDRKYLTDDMKFIQAYHYLKNIKKFSIISLEGKCGAGKTTLSTKLQEKLDLTIINIDDFFLPPVLKTRDRLNEVGGNIDYMRIYNLLLQIRSKTISSYKKYNCHNNTFSDKKIKIQNIVLLEGVYSYHPYFRSLIDKLLYLDIDEKTQDNRIQNRSNYQRFINEWIPLENKYFKSQKLKPLANIII